MPVFKVEFSKTIEFTVLTKDKSELRNYLEKHNNPEHYNLYDSYDWNVDLYIDNYTREEEADVAFENNKIMGTKEWLKRDQEELDEAERKYGIRKKCFTRSFVDKRTLNLFER